MALMLCVGVITGEPNSFIRDLYGVFFGHLRLTPFEIEYVVCDIIPFFTCVFSVVKLFENSAWFILKLSTSGP
jgi:hypothetical protein